MKKNYELTYAELGEEGYAQLHPPASGLPTMRFFKSEKLAHSSSGEGQLIIHPTANKKSYEADTKSSSCVIC